MGYGRSPPQHVKTSPTLLSQLRDGQDILAWDEFFRRYFPLVYGFARRRGCSEHTSEDIVQEVMAKVFERRDFFRYDPARGRFRDWLFAVVRTAIAEYRRRPANRMPPADVPDVEAGGPAVEELWQDAFDQAVLLGVLDVVRREAPPRDFAAFELTALHEVSPQDAARVTGLSRNAVYKARRRILKRLQCLLAGYAGEGHIPERVRAALALRPPPARERVLTGRVTDSLRRERGSAT
jgi:RNA polymerase sigma-70 factor (ECF subfamily)